MPHFYSLTLQKATAINQAVCGNFSGPKAQEVVVSRGKILELLRPDNHGRVQSICSQEVFGLVRSLATFRLVGANRDHIVVGSDSGRIVVLEFDAKSNAFRKIHQETFGKSGCRRIVPGEYLAVDPNGRACMIGAVEKQKFVYILNRDSEQRMTISSPLEAHKQHTILFSLASLDVGFDNPLFASIECNYDHQGQKLFTIHEMDLGINHVVRKYAEPVPDSAHLIIPIAGGSDGPGGCLVCCDNYLIYKKLGRESLTCAYPRRLDAPLDKPIMIIAHGAHKLKDFALTLIQTEQGDVFRVDLARSPNGRVEELRLSYFDTIPRAVNLCILKTGFMFTAAEFGPHNFYQFRQCPLLAPTIEPGITAFCSSIEGESGVAIFKPRTLTALDLIDSVASLCPLTDMKALPAPDGGTNIFALTGRGSGSALRCLSLGVGVNEMAASPLPGKPSGVWTIAGDDGVDKYIVISFVDATLVLAIGETVQEVADSGLLNNVQTICVAKLHDGSLLQTHSRGLRHVHEATGRVTEWRAPGGRQVVAAATNSHQAVLGLTGAEIVYFELSAETGTVQEIAKRDMGCQIGSVALASVPAGRSRALFMAVSGSDKSVRVLSLEPDKLLKQLSAQSYAVAAESTVITDDGFLSIGLVNGTLVRCCLDRVTGVLSDPRSRFLGVRPVRVVKLAFPRRECALALSSKAWLIDPATVGVAPLADAAIECAASFNSELCPDGLVAISGETLRIVSLQTSSTFSERNLPLSYTPRKLCVLPSIVAKDPRVMLSVLESDVRSLTEQARAQLVTELQATHGIDEHDDWSVVCAGSYGNTSASCVRLVDPVSLETHVTLDFAADETATAVAVATFFQLRDKRPCLLVATAEGQVLQPQRSAKTSSIKTYLYDEQFLPQLVHVTPVSEGEGVVVAMCAFEGRLLVALSAAAGVAVLRLYELGKKRLLKKSEYRNSVCGGFVNLQVVGDRIFAGDVFNGVHVLKLNKVDGQMYVVCDDTLPRYLTAMQVVDYNTIVGADKFDNVFVSRIPIEVREDQAGTGEAMVGSGGLRLGPDTTYILGKNHKFEPVNSVHVGETVTSLQKVALAPGASEVILYSTLSGAIGVLYPFSSKKEYNLFLALETHLANAMGTALAGRDHAAFRGYYLPAKAVVDGDLIAAFPRLPASAKSEVAALTGKSSNEIDKLIEEVRNRIT